MFSRFHLLFNFRTKKYKVISKNLMLFFSTQIDLTGPLEEQFSIDRAISSVNKVSLV